MSDVPLVPVLWGSDVSELLKMGFLNSMEDVQVLWSQHRGMTGSCWEPAQPLQ